jgi:hypothetical protein
MTYVGTQVGNCGMFSAEIMTSNGYDGMVTTDETYPA